MYMGTDLYPFPARTMGGIFEPEKKRDGREKRGLFGPVAGGAFSGASWLLGVWCDFLFRHVGAGMWGC